MHTLFGTRPLPAGAWLWMIAAGIAVFTCVEIEKQFMKLAPGRYGQPAPS